MNSVEHKIKATRGASQSVRFLFFLLGTPVLFIGNFNNTGLAIPSFPV
jgi:hypothetical protein